MPEWLSDALKVLGGGIAGLLAFAVAWLNRRTSLAETLRHEQADIRDELHRQIGDLRGQLETERRRNDALQLEVMKGSHKAIPVEWNRLLERMDRDAAPLYPPGEDV